MCLVCGERCRKCVGVGGGVRRVGKHGEVGKMWGRCMEVCLGVGRDEGRSVGKCVRVEDSGGKCGER